MSTQSSPEPRRFPEPVWSDELVKKLLRTGLRSKHEEMVDDLEQFLQPEPEEQCRKFEGLLRDFVAEPERLRQGECSLAEMEAIADRARSRTRVGTEPTTLARRRSELATRWTVLAAALYHHGVLLESPGTESFLEPAEMFQDLSESVPEPWSELFRGAARRLERSEG